MKKVFSIAMGLAFVSGVYAQDFTDAVRYGTDEIHGSARFRAMGGAFGALGGDLSAININPASSAIFNRSEAGFTLGFTSKTNDVSFFNGTTSSDIDNFNLVQGGGVFVYDNSNQNSKWNKFTLGVAYDRTNDYDNTWRANGINTNNSIAEYFRGFANGVPLADISALPGETLSQAYSDIGSVFGFGNQQGFLGFESFLIDPVNDTDGNTEYVNNVEGGNYNQSYFLNTLGYNGKMAFNVATQYDERISLGLNVNAHFLDYERVSQFDESNSNANSLVSRASFDNTLRTTGTGVSFQLGSIVKVTEEFRVGLTYNSPTWFRISEETSQFLQTSGGPESVTINPNVLNIYPVYRLRTPGKVMGSLAYVFGDKGLISFDYARKDFSNMQFRPSSDPFFAFQNGLMSDILGVANTYRFGGEYRLNQLSLRGGYRIEESPYVDGNFEGDLTAFSLGLGYSFGGFALDLAFSQAQRETNYLLYSNAPTFDASAGLNQKFTDVVLTFSFGI